MFLSLTNASPQHRGTRVAIDRKLVVSMHTSIVTRDDDTVEPVTFIFCPPHGTWEVMESFEDVLEQLNSTEW
jgi:hypothetical protein